MRIEYLENEQRESFTFSEKMDYAEAIEKIEAAKALERMHEGKRQNDPGVVRPQGYDDKNNRTNDIVGPKVGMSGTIYRRAKYVANTAPSEIIDELDRGERSITGTYNELRAIHKTRSGKYDTRLPRRRYFYNYHRGHRIGATDVNQVFKQLTENSSE